MKGLAEILNKKRTEVWLITDTLSREEFTALVLTIQLDMSPKGRNFYDKAVSLFTLGDKDKMDNITKKIVLSLAAKQRIC